MQYHYNMRNKNNKLSYKHILLFILFSSTSLLSMAEIDKFQLETLNNAQMLIGREDEYAQQIHHDIDSIKNLNSLSDSVFINILTKDIGYYFHRQGLQSKAIEFFSKTVNAMNEQNKDPKLLLRLYLPLGAAYEEVGLWSNAMEYYHTALNIAQDNDIKPDIARIYNNIGAAYYRIDLDKSLEYIQMALDINSELGSRPELFLNYNNIAAIQMKKGNYDDALDYALMALHMIDKNKDPDSFYIMQTNIGALYSQTGNYQLAISYLESAFNFYTKENNPSNLVTTHILMAELYEKMGIDNEALKHMRIVENELLDKIDNEELEANSRGSLAHIYKEQGNYKKAYENLEIASGLRDSLTMANDIKKINNLEQIYENEQKLRDNERVINENQRVINDMELSKIKTERITTFIIFITVACIIIIIFMFVRSRLKNKLLHTNAMLAQQQIALKEKEKELQDIKEQELKRTIDQKNRELSSYALSYTKDNEFMENLSKELKQLLLEINPRDKEHKEHIRSILAQLSQHDSANNWQEFKYYFEQVHPSFYDNLDELSPGITPRQKRLCAMLYIGLTTKEISTITFREVRSIESARNRLRKKLDVPAEESIQEYLSRKLG